TRPHTPTHPVRIGSLGVTPEDGRRGVGAEMTCSPRTGPRNMGLRDAVVAAGRSHAEEPV
ncbi:MAG: hypothetical protein ACREX3_13795, partial [Gammaproteobacteria bacterium]